MSRLFKLSWNKSNGIEIVFFKKPLLLSENFLTSTKLMDSTIELKLSESIDSIVSNSFSDIQFWKPPSKNPKQLSKPTLDKRTIASFSLPWSQINSIFLFKIPIFAARSWKSGMLHKNYLKKYWNVFNKKN